jgi:hypothetical protein
MDSYSFCQLLEESVLNKIQEDLKTQKVTEKRAKEIAAIFLVLISEEYSVTELITHTKDLVKIAPELKDTAEEVTQKLELGGNNVRP